MTVNSIFCQKSYVNFDSKVGKIIAYSFDWCNRLILINKMLEFINHCIFFLLLVTFCDCYGQSNGRDMADRWTRPPKNQCNINCNHGKMVCYKGQNVHQCYLNCLGKVCALILNWICYHGVTLRFFFHFAKKECRFWRTLFL